MSKRERRHQVKSACSHCRKKHAGCDDRRPCSRCVRLGLADTCCDAPKKRKKLDDGDDCHGSNALFTPPISPLDTYRHTSSSPDRMPAKHLGFDCSPCEIIVRPIEEEAPPEIVTLKTSAIYLNQAFTWQTDPTFPDPRSCSADNGYWRCESQFPQMAFSSPMVMPQSCMNNHPYQQTKLGIHEAHCRTVSPLVMCSREESQPNSNVTITPQVVPTLSPTVAPAPQVPKYQPFCGEEFDLNDYGQFYTPFDCDDIGYVPVHTKRTCRDPYMGSGNYGNGFNFGGGFNSGLGFSRCSSAQAAAVGEEFLDTFFV